MHKINPDWPVPANIKAFTTIRHQGVSEGPFASFNLAHHVNDKAKAVESNRQQLLQQLPADPFWLTQIHSNRAIAADPSQQNAEADAAYTRDPHRVCCVLTADCLPILLCNQRGTQVAAIHGGWRGLAKGIIEKTLLALNESSKQILAWLGPAISAAHYEVGDDVRQAFITLDPRYRSAFQSAPNHKWHADIYQLARQQLQQLGVHQIYGGDYCTYGQEDLFFSYRRDGETGRMASVIWIDADADTIV